MPASTPTWSLLVYKIPPQPTRCRLAIWRRLQKLGALYLQDGVAILPARADLTENFHYIAQAIEEMGGTCHLFASTSLLPGDSDTLVQRFREQAEKSLAEIAERLTALEERAGQVDDLEGLRACEEELRRERTAFLRAQQRAYFGANGVDGLTARLDHLRELLAGIGEGK